MKIALLGYAGSIHLLKLANSLAHKNIEVIVITQHEPLQNYDKNIKIFRLPFSGKLGYRLNATSLRTILRKETPDILHAHFASGYGTLGRLAGYTPYILSVWGSDIYIFSRKGSIPLRILKANLGAATIILSTSEDMAQATEKISGKGVVVTRFGVDTDKFKPQKSPSTFVIGTVRALQNIYGIDILIKAFALFSRRPPGKKARLLIVGDGPLRNDLEELTISLGISDKVEFRGKVSHEKIPDILSEMSLFAVLSRSESYCVAALEAQACGLPVVASNVGGLPEVVDNEVTGILIPPENPEAAAKAFARISSDSALRESMSKAAVSFVRKKFNEDNCTEKILEIYRELL